MRYLFDEPFVVDSTAITTELGATVTPAAEAQATTRAAYESARSALPR